MPNSSTPLPSPASWRLLPTSAGPAETELAQGEGLLVGLSHTPQPALRWYEATQPALVLGSGQRPQLEVAWPAATDLMVHKRASGGGAVLFWPGFMMQDLVLPPGHPLYRQDVSESYRWLGEVWVATLARLGLSATLVSIAAARADRADLHPLLRRVCYAGRSPYEVMVAGRKLVGLAQTRRRQGCLFQVGLYHHWPGVALSRLLQMEPSERNWLSAAMRERVVGLDELLPTPPTLATLMDAFAVALQEHSGVTLEAADWRADELSAAAAAQSRFAALN
ncbi:MAG: lipoate--protein ligase family protein [Oscillochloridaceae bacterium umkhey_bin13]